MTGLIGLWCEDVGCQARGLELSGRSIADLALEPLADLLQQTVVGRPGQQTRAPSSVVWDPFFC